MNKLVKKKKKGFTLIELIAVIAILAVLAVIAVPRVISYVEKSKKVAIQTEATTIYNAAEAAYNDGKLTDASNNQLVSGSTKFNDVDFIKAVDGLEHNDLLSGDTNVSKFNGKVTKLGDLKTIMNADVNTLNVNGNGQLVELPTVSEASAPARSGK